MKRTLSYLLICALTLGLLAGYGAPADAATEQQPADEPTTTTTEQTAQDTVTLEVVLYRTYLRGHAGGQRRDSVYYDLQLLDQILTLFIQAVIGGELQ